MINLDNKVIYENLRKQEKINYVKGTMVLLIMAGIIIFGVYNILEQHNQTNSERIEYILDNKSIVDNKIESNTKEKWIKITIAVNIPLFILMIYFFIKGARYEKEANRYCPYCYTKDFITTTLNTKKIRSYVKKEKYNDSNGNEKIKRILYEDWEGQYRNECCGQVYQKTWQNKIDLG